MPHFALSISTILLPLRKPRNIIYVNRQSIIHSELLRMYKNNFHIAHFSTDQTIVTNVTYNDRSHMF